MTTPARTSGGRVYYERGVLMELAFPTFAAAQSRCTVMRNPTYDAPHEQETLPQGSIEDPTGRALATSIASDPVRFLPAEFPWMTEGFPQAQHANGVVELHCDSASDVLMPGKDFLVSIGFRSFDGVEPTGLELQELDGVGTVLVTHAFTVGVADRKAHPQGLLRQLDVTFTANASTNQLRVRMESAGESFAVTDIHAISSLGDSYADVDQVFDTDADGVGDCWILDAGSESDCLHYGEDASALRQWYREICDGALRTFQMRRHGDGVIFTVKWIYPVDRVGWDRKTAGTVQGVSLVFEDQA